MDERLNEHGYIIPGLGMRETVSLVPNNEAVRRDSVHKRPSWDRYFMQIADLVSSVRFCLRRQVGALLVKERRVIATGYNGAPRGYLTVLK